MPNQTTTSQPIRLTTPESLMAALRALDDAPQVLCTTASLAIHQTYLTLLDRAAEASSDEEHDAIRHLSTQAENIHTWLATEHPQADPHEHLTFNLRRTGTSRTGWAIASAEPTQPPAPHPEPTPPRDSMTGQPLSPAPDLSHLCTALADAIIQAACAEQPTGAADLHLRIKRITTECEGFIYRQLHLPG